MQFGTRRAHGTTADKSRTANRQPPGEDSGEGVDGDRGNLTAKTLGGLKWTYSTTAALAVMQIGYQAVVGRLLPPETFGLMAMALLAMRFLKMFADIGLSRALVQKAEVTEEDIRAAFGSSIVMGVTVYLIVWVSAPSIAAFFKEPAVVQVLRVTALALIAIGAMSVSESLLRRELRFKDIAKRTLAGYVVGYLIVGLTLAYLGAGIWALVAAMLTSFFLGALLTYERVRHPLRPLFSWARIKPLFGFGGRVSVISFMEWIGTNLDTVAVGRFATAAMLGQYNRAYFLTSYPTSQLTRNMSQVLFPSFSRIQQDVPRLRSAYLGAITVAAFALLPMTVGMAVAAQELVLVILGSQWQVAADVLPLLSLAVGVNVLSHFAGVVCEARAALNSKLALQGFYIVVLAGLLFAARGHGLWAYAAALLAGEVVRHLLYIVLLRKVVGVSVPQIVSHYTPGLLTAGVVAGTIAGGRRALLSLGAAMPLILIAEIALGGLVLIIMLRFGPTGVVRDVLRSRLRRGAGMMPGSRSDQGLTLLVGRGKQSEAQQEVAP